MSLHDVDRRAMLAQVVASGGTGGRLRSVLRLDRSRARPSPCCSGGEVARPRRAHRRCRPTCRPRSCGPSGRCTTTMPPVMYSQPWSPVPSTTAMAPGVAHREALARDAAEVALARDGAVEHRVADDDRLLRHDLAGRLPADRRSAGRPRGPCRHSRWPRLRAPASRRGPARRRSSGRRCPSSFTWMVSSGRPAWP